MKVNGELLVSWLTPALVSVALAVLGFVYKDLREVRETVARFSERVAIVETRVDDYLSGHRIATRGHAAELRSGCL